MPRPHPRWSALLLLVGPTWTTTGCERQAAAHAASAPPARLERASSEDELATVALTPEAEQRLDLIEHLTAVGQRELPHVRVFPGRVVAAPGHDVWLTAPQPGLLMAAAEGPPLSVGRRVQRGELLGWLHPLLGAGEAAQLQAALAEACGQLEREEVLAAAAGRALERVERLVGERAASQRSLEEARAQADAAEAALAAARARRAALAGALAPATGTARGGGAIPLFAPLEGVVLELSAAPGQVLGAGASIARVASLSPVWVRVSLPAADAERIDRPPAIRVGPLSAAPPLPWRATPVDVPPLADPLTATLDLAFQVEEGADLVPGQRLAAEVPLSGAGPVVVIPWAAVLHDLNGATWVYLRVGPGRYRRARVEVQRVAGELAVLDPHGAPPPGAEVVTDGAAELYGAELGMGH